MRAKTITAATAAALLVLTAGATLSTGWPGDDPAATGATGRWPGAAAFPVAGALYRETFGVWGLGLCPRPEGGQCLPSARGICEAEPGQCRLAPWPAAGSEDVPLPGPAAPAKTALLPLSDIVPLTLGGPIFGVGPVLVAGPRGTGGGGGPQAPFLPPVGPQPGTGGGPVFVPVASPPAAPPVGGGLPDAAGPAVVPLPTSLPFLLAALGLLGLTGRNRR
ncbi:PEP-CTERM sorting domain-containing protein [Rhodovulum euryhalinum]|uniref:Secreted protein n=1 Tax=Rhodovulum euryhalinum TaxID=35805 RepID=A0A4R2KUG4_9RHOB|nr:PEP-CTERM sorting domain-containing protein [Rhodovulum euryhalinum]TCO70365.1 hypothetical protein EV655_110130 [Rhodovulum euryhalinum]